MDEVNEEEIQTDELIEDDAAPQVREGFEEIAEKVSKNIALSDDELDQVADVAIEVLHDMLSFYDAQDATIDEYSGNNGQLIFNVLGEDLGILIGYHGKVLEAFKYMFSVLFCNELGFKYPARVDIEGYDSRQLQKLESIANNAARRALQRGSEVRMRPMRPYERRIIHLTLRSNKKVTTHSEGSEPNRCVVVVPVK